MGPRWRVPGPGSRVTGQAYESRVPGEGSQVESPGSRVPRMGPASHFSSMPNNIFFIIFKEL